MKRIIAVMIALAGALSAVYAGQKGTPCQLIPVSLTCERMSQPNCIDVEKPRLSWINSPLDPQVKGAGQTAYRIRVASTREGLAYPDLWDSRKAGRMWSGHWRGNFPKSMTGI